MRPPKHFFLNVNLFYVWGHLIIKRKEKEKIKDKKIKIKMIFDCYLMQSWTFIVQLIFAGLSSFLRTWIFSFDTNRIPSKLSWPIN